MKKNELLPDVSSKGEHGSARMSSREKMHLVREKYLRNLPQYLGRVEDQWRRLLEDRTNRDEMRSLHGMLHTLAGSAPSFGLTEVGEAAKRAETLLWDMLENSEGFAAGQWTLVDASLDDLQGTFGDVQEEERARIRFEESTPVCPLGLERDRKLIFLVDDDVDLLQNLAVQIECFGYHVRCFSTLTAVLNEVSRELPAAIVMDLMFPEGGVAGAEMIADIQRTTAKHIPVVFISQRHDFTARLESVRAGGDAYLTKPLHISRLIEKLDLLTEDREADPYRILIIDDDPELSQFYALTLQDNGMLTRVVNDPMKVVEHLVEFNPELILMDMYMEGCYGDELAMIIRQMEAYVSIPIVYLSAETRKERQFRAMRIGADDFLTKPIKPEHLISSVTIRAERMRIIRSFMERDSLTGLLNHTKTKEQLDLAVLRARRSGGVMSFAMVDIDAFKAVNDTYGHLAGDRVIVILSRLLQQRLRKTDVVGRYGGEEFAVILMDSTAEQASKVMDEIRCSFEQVRHESDLGDFYVTFSCGIASFPDFHDPVTLCREADKALYEVKNNGRNRVRIRSPRKACKAY